MAKAKTKKRYSLIVMSDTETSDRPDRNGVYCWLTGFKICGLLDNQTNNWVEIDLPTKYFYYYGKNSTEELLNGLMNISREYTNIDTDMIVFFHNARFDSSYLMHHILYKHNGYEDSKLHQYFMNRVVVDDDNNFYGCQIGIRDCKRERYYFTVKDLYKILPCKLAVIGDSLGLPKGKDFDYDMVRSYDYVPTKKELEEYFFIDIEIMVEAYKKMPQFFYKGFTIGSITKKYFLSNYCQDYRKIFPNIGACCEYVYHNGELKPVGNRSMNEVNKAIIRGYKGGMTIVNNKYLGKTLYNDKLPLERIPVTTQKLKITDMIYHFDVNSLYPYVMYNDMPIGLPKIILSDYEIDNSKELEEYLLSLTDKRIIVRVDFKRIIVKDGKAPLFLKNDLKTIIYRTQKDKNIIDNFNSYKSFYNKHQSAIEYLTMEEFQLLKENYKFKYTIYEAYVFNTGKNIFKGFIDEMADKKIEYDNNEFLRLCYKLCMNNLYGKMGEKAEKITRKNMLDENGNWCTGNTFNKEEKGNLLIPKTGDYFYPACAIYITSYARMRMIKFINIVGWENVLYMDTDSIHIADDKAPEKLKDYIHDTQLGMLKLEDICYGEKCLSPKKYVYYGLVLKKGKEMFRTKCAGLPDSAQKSIITFDQFDYGLTFIPKHLYNNNGTFTVNKNGKDIEIPLPKNNIPVGKLAQKFVFGGIKLVPCLFSINTPEYLKLNESILDDCNITQFIL